MADTPALRPHFGSVDEWMRRWLAVSIDRRIGDAASPGACWCEQWWEHPEALERFTGLWEAWEAARVQGQMDAWWRSSFEFAWRTLTAGDGPFRDCHPSRHGMSAQHRAPADPSLPVVPMPRVVAGPGSGTELDGWIRGWLAGTIDRRIGDAASPGACWCEQWWEHPEALVRFTGLWRAWEAARAQQQMDAWWRNQFDPGWRTLTAADGPFRDCHPTRAGRSARHRAPARPSLPMRPMPPHLATAPPPPASDDQNPAVPTPASAAAG